MPNIEKAKNQAGKTIFPVTVADAVLMGNGKTLKGELSELGSEVGFLIDDTYNVKGATRCFSLKPYIGKNVEVKVVGDFAQAGYYDTALDLGYKVVVTTSGDSVEFVVPETATDFFVYNESEMGSTEVWIRLIAGHELRVGLLERTVHNLKEEQLNLKEEQESRLFTLKFSLSINNGASSRFFDLSKHIGDELYVTVNGNMTQLGYYDDSESKGYYVLSYVSERTVKFKVPETATSLFVFNNTGATSNVEVFVESKLYGEIRNSQNIFGKSAKLAFCSEGIIDIDFNVFKYSIDCKYYSLGSGIVGNVSGFKNKDIISRNDGTYQGQWFLLLNITSGNIEFYYFDRIPNDLTDYYVVAFGCDNKVLFSTSEIYPNDLSQSNILSKQNCFIFNNKIEGFGNIDELLNTSSIKDLSEYIVQTGGSITKYSTINYDALRIFVPRNTTFSSSFTYKPLFTFTAKIGDDGKARCYFSAMLKHTSNFVGFYILTNGGWSTPNTKIVGGTDSFKEVKAYAEIVGNVGTTVTFGLYAYFSFGSAVTLSDDLDVYIYNLSLSEKPINSVGSYKMMTKSDVENIISNKTVTEGCVIMSLGDSISTESYYMPKLRQLLKPSKYYNLAVASATWADRSNTRYDGNPLFNGTDNNMNNVIGNQLQKIINNPNTYNVAPDIIIIAAGTNDGQPIDVSASQQEIIEDIDSHFYNNGAIPITKPTFDASDTYMDHRKTIAGAMRYVVCKLQEMYPSARIYILTPIQASYSSRNYGSSIASKQLYITETAKHLAVPVIHVGEECGIQSDFEYLGAMWKEPSGSNEKSGRDLVDGLHPNTSGSWKMAKYIANKLKHDYVEQSY